MAGKKGRSGKLAGRDARDFNLLISKSYTYLYNNFMRFDEEKRFHLALEIVKKAMPRDVVVSGSIDISIANKLKEGRDRINNLSRFETELPSEN